MIMNTLNQDIEQWENYRFIYELQDVLNISRDPDGVINLSRCSINIDKILHKFKNAIYSKIYNLYTIVTFTKKYNKSDLNFHISFYTPLPTKPLKEIVYDTCNNIYNNGFPLDAYTYNLYLDSRRYYYKNLHTKLNILKNKKTFLDKLLYLRREYKFFCISLTELSTNITDIIQNLPTKLYRE